MRLLQAIGGAKFGGAEAFFDRLAIALHRAGQDQIVLIRDPDHAARLRAAGVAAEKLRFGNSWLDGETRRRFRAAVESYRPDVVLTWMSRATQLCPSGDFVHVARLGGYYPLKHYRGCDHLIGNTRDIVAWLERRGWPASRAHYVPNFVDVQGGSTDPLRRAAFATPANVPLALALGRLHRNKAFDVLIDAVAKTERVHLWIAGDGPLRQALGEQVIARGLAGRVRFLGWRDDIPSLLATADMLVCPSRHEPLGNVVIEGWAAGIPVVAAASVGPVALIRDGESGLLAPVDDADALAGAMERLAEDDALRARLVAGGHAAHEAEFTEAQVVASYRRLFDTVTAGRS